MFNNKFSLKKVFKRLGKSVACALIGLRFGFKKEQSFRIQLLVAVVVVIAMFVLPFHYLERAILVLAMGFVLSLELLNSQIERVLDMVEPKESEKVKNIKDLSAGAVLIACLAAFFSGVFILISRFF